MNKTKLEEAWATRFRLSAEADKHLLESGRLQREGDALWRKAVLEVHGDIKMTWEPWTCVRYACKLETGEVFEPYPKENDDNSSKD